MSIKEQSLDEAKKSSFDVNAEVPDATGVTAKKLPGSKDQGDSTNPEQGSSVKAKITKEDINVKDDVTAIFEGSDLSDEFKTKATEIFEAAVVSSVNVKLAELEEKHLEDHDAELASINEAMTTKIDEYLDYVVDQWMTENKLAVESGLRAEITENFLTGLRDLFVDHYIDIPEEKVQVVEEMSGQIEKLEADVNESIAENIELKKKVEEFERAFAFAEVSEGLTEIQISKLESLAESIDFTDADSYAAKLKSIKESFFSKNTEITETSKLDEEPVDENLQEEVHGSMKAYVQSISRTVKK